MLFFFVKAGPICFCPIIVQRWGRIGTPRARSSPGQHPHLTLTLHPTLFGLHTIFILSRTSSLDVAVFDYQKLSPCSKVRYAFKFDLQKCFSTPKRMFCRIIWQIMFIKKARHFTCTSISPNGSTFSTSSPEFGGQKVNLHENDPVCVYRWSAGILWKFWVTSVSPGILSWSHICYSSSSIFFRLTKMRGWCKRDSK